MREEVFRMSGVTQENSGIQTLHNINLNIFKGEILGLAALDDLGLDDLVSLMCRNQPIKYGKVYFKEKLVNSGTKQGITANKVYVIEKESRLVPGLSIADNVFVLRSGFKKYLIQPSVLCAQVEKHLRELGVSVSPRALCEELTGYERCVIELLKAVLQGVGLVVLREISDILGRADLERFQKIVSDYAKEGISFLYICSHHEEAFPFCDRMLLLEDGYLVKVFEKDEMTDENIEPYIITIKRKREEQPEKEEDSGSILAFRKVKGNRIRNLSFEVKKGECITLLDNDNYILQEILDLLMGARQAEAGKILLGNQVYTCRSGADALDHGAAVIRENPLKTMLFYEMSYMENLLFLVDRKLNKTMILKKIQRSVINEFSPVLGEVMYTRNIDTLSLEDLYNLIYYRVILYKPKVLFCVQPFSGADMYLRKHIAKLMDECRAQGISIVILAVRLSDTLRVSDRLYVIENGEVQKEYKQDEYQTEFRWQNK